MKKIKGLVMEVKDKHIYLVTKDGEFIKAPLTGKQPKIGEEITVKLRPKPNYLKYAAIAALIMLMLVIPTLYVYSQPAAYVCVDINPSVQLSVTSNNIVQKAAGLNPEGMELIQKVRPQNKPLDLSLALLIDGAITMGYIDKSKENIIQIAYYEKRNNTVNARELQNIVKKELEEAEIDSYLQIAEADAEILEKAKENKVSLNKVILQKHNPNKIKDEELKKPMSKIIEKAGREKILKQKHLIKAEQGKGKDKTQDKQKPKGKPNNAEDKNKAVPGVVKPGKETAPNGNYNKPGSSDEGGTTRKGKDGKSKGNPQKENKQPEDRPKGKPDKSESSVSKPPTGPKNSTGQKVDSKQKDREKLPDGSNKGKPKDKSPGRTKKDEQFESSTPSKGNRRGR